MYPQYTYRRARQKRRSIKKNTLRNVVLVLVPVVILFGAGLIYLSHRAEARTPKTNKATTHQTAATTAPSTPAPSAPAVAAVITKLENDWASTMSGRSDVVDIAVYDSKNGQTAHYTNTSAGTVFYTASTVKLSILEDLLIQDQANNTGLTSGQMSYAAPMIEDSDDNSATVLWQEDGGTSALDSFFSKVGALSTQAGDQDYWGLTTTTAEDQLKVVNQFAYPSSLLTSSSQDQIVDLLNQVTPSQHWGVSGGVPSNVSVDLKNGWLPDSETFQDPYMNTDDWIINSIGHIYGDGQDYTIAVYTDGNSSEEYGIDTIQALSTVTWNDLSA